MTTNTKIRTERRFEVYSRGLELVRAIKAMWEANEADRYRRADFNAVVEGRIKAITTEHDLTVAEWHYWCRKAQGEA